MVAAKSSEHEKANYYKLKLMQMDWIEGQLPGKQLGRMFDVGRTKYKCVSYAPYIWL